MSKIKTDLLQLSNKLLKRETDFIALVFDSKDTNNRYVLGNNPATECDEFNKLLVNLMFMYDLNPLETQKLCSQTNQALDKQLKEGLITLQ